MRRGSVGVGLILVGLALSAGSFAVTRQEIVDAILQRTSCPSCDLDGSGSVDAVDLVCLEFQCHREAQFSTNQTIVDEGDGLVLIEVTLESAVTGTLNYSISGTATAGADYVTPSGTVAVNGTVVSIPVTITDDTDFHEELETIELSIEAGADYGLGDTLEHQIVIVDNDTPWVGTLEPREGSVRFTMNVTQSPAGFTATLVGAEDGTFPTGSFPGSFDLTSTIFRASIGSIPLAADETAFEAAITRSIELNPESGSACDPDGTPLDQIVVEPSLVAGLFCETLTFAGRPGLDRTITGNFTLAKVPPPPSSALLALTPAP